MGESDRNAYEENLKDYRDLKSSLLTAYKEGVDEGIEIGVEQTRLKLEQFIKQYNDEWILHRLGLRSPIHTGENTKTKFILVGMAKINPAKNWLGQ